MLEAEGAAAQRPWGRNVPGELCVFGNKVIRLLGVCVTYRLRIGTYNFGSSVVITWESPCRIE